MTLVQLLKLVISSWQVLAVTVAIVIYFSIVSYASRSHHRSRPVKKPKVKKKKETPAEAIAGPETTESDENHVDDLGIEEA
jgi:hypothetical protein